MKDDANPTAWQLAGLALALGIVVTGVALADEPRLEVGGEPGGVVQTVDESPERQRELVRLLDEAEDADDHDGPDEAVEPADDASVEDSDAGGEDSDASGEEAEAVVEEPAAEPVETGDGDGEDAVADVEGGEGD